MQLLNWQNQTVNLSSITFSHILKLPDISFNPITLGVILGGIIMLLLLLSSAMISGSEVAFFSLSPSHINSLKEKNTGKNKKLLELLKYPQRLLATILIANNFVNVGIIILSTFLTVSIVDFSNAPIWGFVFQVVIITFLLLLFGEIIPKVYANYSSMSFALFMTLPFIFLSKLLRPISYFLISSTNFVNKRIKQSGSQVSIDDLSNALDLTANTITENKKILRGIVTFGNIEVKSIMTARVDVTAIENKTPFKSLLQTIIDSGYSRIPVYEETFDKVKGILYIKDLLPYLNKEDFNWQTLIRPPYFVPEMKKINDLLEEFQTKKIHMAIVVDEYGGTSGIVTLEDILEEIVGEINDENDEDDPQYSKIDDHTYIFEGKTLVNDFCRLTSIPEKSLEPIRGEADTLAGLILEMKKEIPKKEETINYDKLSFKILAVDKRRIKQIQLKIKN